MQCVCVCVCVWDCFFCVHIIYSCYKKGRCAPPQESHRTLRMLTKSSRGCLNVLIVPPEASFLLAAAGDSEPQAPASAGSHKAALCQSTCECTSQRNHLRRELLAHSSRTCATCDEGEGGAFSEKRSQDKPFGPQGHNLFRGPCECRNMLLMFMIFLIIFFILFTYLSILRVICFDDQHVTIKPPAIYQLENNNWRWILM